MVTDDVAAAARLVSAGHNVVVVTDEADLPTGWPDVRADGAGRVAFFVGRLDDPTERAAAEAMDAELFGR